MGIPYRGFGLITMDGTTHDTSLLYAATRGRPMKHLSPTLAHGGSTAHRVAGTTCHIALAVIRQLRSPNTQAMRTLLPMSHHRDCIRHRQGGKRTHISHTPSICIPPGTRCFLTTPSVIPQPKTAGHHHELPKTALGAGPLSAHRGISPHPAGRSLGHPGPPSRHLTIASQSAVGPNVL